MATEVEVVRPGLFTSIQDAGRPGLAFYGVPASGFMDPAAAAAANRMVGRDEDAALIECNLLPPTLRFDDEVRFALAGADMSWQLDGAPVDRYTTLVAPPGAVLQGRYTTNGARAYVAVAGALRCRRDYASAATYDYARLGGLDGKRLEAGDRLTFDRAGGQPQAQSEAPPNYDAIERIVFDPGPEWGALTDAAKSLFASGEFVVGDDSNRMGARLEGPALEMVSPAGRSVPLYPGFIQLPPSGNPIVILQDGQTTGGYARIASLATEELARFNQIRPRRSFKFERRGV